MAALDQAAAAMNDVAGQATMPMSTFRSSAGGAVEEPTPVSANAATPPFASATPSGTVAPAATAVGPLPAESHTVGTKPTVPVPQINPTPLPSSADAPRKSSMADITRPRNYGPPEAFK